MPFLPTPDQLLDPFVARWALRALRHARDLGDGPRVAALEALFAPATITALLEGPDPILASNLLQQLPSTGLEPAAPLLLERWQSWPPFVGMWAVEALGRIAPQDLLPGLRAWSDRADLREERRRLRGTLRAAAQVGPPAAAVARHLLACIERLPDGKDLLEPAIRMAVRALPDQLPALLLRALQEHAPDPSRGSHDDLDVDEESSPFHWAFAATFAAASEHAPHLDLVHELLRPWPGEAHDDLAPLFADPACLEAVDDILAAPPAEGIRWVTALLDQTDTDLPVVVLARELVLRLGPKAGLGAPWADELLAFLAATQLLAASATAPDLEALDTQTLLRTACLDAERLPWEELLVEVLAARDPAELVPMLNVALLDHHDGLAAGRLLRIMGRARAGGFLETLIEIGLRCDQEGDTEAAIWALAWLGPPAEEALIRRWALLDPWMVPHAWQVLARIGGEASVAHLRARFPRDKRDLLALESLSGAALALADPGLVELLEAELPRDIPCVNEAWVTLCALHRLDRSGLIATRARIEQRYGEAVQGTEALLGIGGQDPFGSGPMNLALECGACGSQNHYRVSALWLDPDKPGDSPHIGDDIRCPSCGGEGPVDIAPMGMMAILTEAAKVKAAADRDLEYRGPLRLELAATLEGPPSSIPAILRQLRARLERNPDDLDARLAVGNMLLDVGPRHRAREHLDRCLQLEPRCAEAAFGLARLTRDEGEPERAFALLHGIWALQDHWHVLRLTRDTELDFIEEMAELHDELARATGHPRLPPGAVEAVSLEKVPRSRAGAPKNKTARSAGTSPRSRRPARNAPCPCGSGRKYKGCCGKKM